MVPLNRKDAKSINKNLTKTKYRMTTTSNIVLLIMFVIGVILTATGISMTFSDMNDDIANHSITPHLLTLIIGIVLIGVSASFGLKKVGKYLSG